MEEQAQDDARQDDQGGVPGGNSWQVFDTHACRNTPPGPPLPSAPDFDLPLSMPPLHPLKSLDSIIDSLGETHAAFLFDGSLVSSANIVQAIDINLPTISTFPDI